MNVASPSDRPMPSPPAPSRLTLGPSRQRARLRPRRVRAALAHRTCRTATSSKAIEQEGFQRTSRMATHQRKPPNCMASKGLPNPIDVHGGDAHSVTSDLLGRSQERWSRRSASLFSRYNEARVAHKRDELQPTCRPHQCSRRFNSFLLSRDVGGGPSVDAINAASKSPCPRSTRRGIPWPSERRWSSCTRTIGSRIHQCESVCVSWSEPCRGAEGLLDPGLVVMRRNL